MSGATTSTITIRRAGEPDAARLASLARSTFVETFAADNDPADMAAYVDDAFGEPRQRDELRDPRTTVLLAERDGAPVGYAMLREGAAPACVGAAHAIEIVRLYAVGAAIGSGVGAALMAHCLAAAAESGHQVIWLGVWEHNARAIGFYTRWGFADVGSHHFQLGRDRQTDRIMTRRMEHGR